MSIFGIMASLRDAQVVPIFLFVVIDAMMVFLVWIEFRK